MSTRSGLYKRPGEGLDGVLPSNTYPDEAAETLSELSISGDSATTKLEGLFVTPENQLSSGSEASRDQGNKGEELQRPAPIQTPFATENSLVLFFFFRYLQNEKCCFLVESR
jgi:hypothetical protein